MLFLILTVIIFNLVVLFIPKRISGIEMLTTTLSSSILELMFNIFLDLKYDLYGYFDKGVDWEALIYILGIYPAVNIVFLNYFPYKRLSIFLDGHFLRMYMSYFFYGLKHFIITVGSFGIQ